MASRRRRSRRSWGYRVRRGLVRHRSIALRSALVIAVLAELWLLWPDPRPCARSAGRSSRPPPVGRAWRAQRRLGRRGPGERRGLGQATARQASRLWSSTVSSRGCSRSPGRCRTSACLTRRRLARRLPRATRQPNLRTPIWRSVRRRERSAWEGAKRRRCTRCSDGRACRSGYGAAWPPRSVRGMEFRVRPRHSTNLPTRP